jgi:hypothetical protein
MKMIFDYNVEKDPNLGLYKATLTVGLPEITVIRHKADRNDFKYDLRRAVSELVEEIVEKHLDD